MLQQTLNDIYCLNIKNLNRGCFVPIKAYQRENNVIFDILQFKIILIAIILKFDINTKLRKGNLL